MNIKRAKEEIKNTIEAYLLKDEHENYAIPSIRQRPVLLIGPPGVGKTQIMEQISQELGIGLIAYTITHHTRQSAVGLPFIEKKTYGGREYSVTEYTLSEIVASVYEKMEETGLKEGILFIDEINCVSETLAPTMLQFLQCKTFGNHRIPEGWLIAAAGNPPEYNKSVREFDVVTLDRIKKIMVEPDFEVWKEYAYRENIHPAILSYLSIKGQNFCRIETTVDGKLFATPRGWEDLSQFLQVYEKLGKTADREVIIQYIQYPAIAKDFANYLELYYKYQNDYQVDEILAGKRSETLCQRLSRAPFDEKISVVGLLLARLNNGFRSLALLEQVLEQARDCLKGYQHGLEGKTRTDFEALTEDWNKSVQEKEKAGLLSLREQGISRRVSGLLEDYRRQLQQADIFQGEAIWQWLRTCFEREAHHYEELLEDCGQKLEYAFDFMEATFGSSQEMVLFVTELNSSEYSIRFLQEYECSRYYQYNQTLLFDEQEELIRRQADRR